MARLANISASVEENNAIRDTETASARRQRPSRTPRHAASLSPSPAASFSSDKENREAATDMSRQGKGKSRAPVPSKLPTPTSAEPATPRTNKRRRLEDRDAPMDSQAIHQRELDEAADTQYYDPDQAPEERRAVRKALRDLTRDLNDSRSEYLTPGSTGLIDTLQRANQYFASVKQTSDATLDSRLLVTTADLSYRKTAQLTLGDATQGIDLDEFVSKCITFMRRGPSEEEDAPTGRGHRRRGRNTADDDDDISAQEDSADEGDAFNWDYLGRRLCFPHNRRPAVPGFLLGPLSVQKRVRKPIQRRERLQKRNPADVIRPEELQKADLEKAENSNLTTLCRNIRDTLAKIQTEGIEKADMEATEDMTESETEAIMRKYGVCSDGGVSFFRFVVNPQSFGQTVENLFYVSFLIRDGIVGIGKDAHGLPTLHGSSASTREQIKSNGMEKHQAIFHLDFPIWEDLIDAFDITTPMIPHRQSDEGAQVSATGWYG